MTGQRGRVGAPPSASADDLRKIIHYNPDTGALTWINSRRRVAAGSPAGSPQSNGYISITIDGHRYQAHRLAWYLMTGEWPETGIDHRDTDVANNRWDNLRLATHQQNGWNQPGRAASGYKGVYSTPSGKWTARIKIDGRILNFPSRETPEEAHADYVAAAREHHGAFARIA